MVFHSKEVMEPEGFRQRCAEYIMAHEGGSKRKMEKSAKCGVPLSFSLQDIFRGSKCVALGNTCKSH